MVAHIPAVLSPRYGENLTHALSHITRAVAAMDSCFVIVRTHQNGVAFGHLYDPKAVFRRSLLPSHTLIPITLDDPHLHTHCMAERMRKVLTIPRRFVV